MHIAFYGRKNYFPFSISVFFLNVRLQNPHGSLHRFSTFQNKWQLHLSGSKALTHNLHARKQNIIDDIERRVFLKCFKCMCTNLILPTINNVVFEFLLNSKMIVVCGGLLFGICICEKCQNFSQRIRYLRSVVEQKCLEDFPMFV